MILKKVKNIKFEYIIILIAILVSICWSNYNLKKFDNVKINFIDRYYNQFLYSDLNATWKTADKFRKNLKEGNTFLNSIPEYEKFLLPSIIVGYYYYLIDTDIYEKKDNGQFVIKENNFKFGLLVLQILIYFFSLIFFSTELKKIVNKNLYRIIIIFLALEPTLLQWHSSLWNESIFLSLMLILFTLMLKKTDKILIKFSIGIVVGLLFMQRAIGFLYIIPVIFYLFLTNEKKIKSYLSLFAGFLVVILFVGFNNFKKTDHFYILSIAHQYYAYYYYFADDILANKKKISNKEAREILKIEEENWIKENNIDLSFDSEGIIIGSFKDISKNIKYRNKIFLREALSNPIYTSKKLIKGIVVMSIIHPFWVNENFYYDKHDPAAKENPKKYYNKNLHKNILYSFFIYVFVIIGIINLIKRLIREKKINEFDKFLFFNTISIFYFILFSGMWGNPKYFIPCMLSLSFYFSIGFEEFKKKFINKKK